jgi:spore coat polysaccharide biosynthesis predicted glycosyltransferase SpsG
LSGSVIIRCDASSRVGFGHVIRCLALAEELRPGWDVAFAMLEGASVVEEHGFPVYGQPDEASCTEEMWLLSLVSETAPAVLILDIRTDLSVVELKRTHPGCRLVTVDDSSDRRLCSDLVFCPPVPQVKRLDWTGFAGELFSGWEWVVLRPGFDRPRRNRPVRDGVSSEILVTMGGSDPAGLSLRVLRALNDLDRPMNIKVLLGPGFSDTSEIRQWTEVTGSASQIVTGCPDPAELMAEADLAIASFGMTAYELASLGTPAIHLCLTDDHAESATAFSEAGLALSLGNHRSVSGGDIRKATAGLLDNPSDLEQMGARASRMIDTGGARRIANIIRARVER